MADEYYQIPEDPQYSIDDIRKLRTDDPANAETIFNPLFLRVLENIAAVHNGADGAGAEATAAAKAAADAAAAALAAAQAAATAQQMADTAQKSASTAQQTANTANTAAANAKSAADTAQSTANSAATAAAKAQSTADAGLKLKTGSYSGTNTATHTITVGFRPKFLFITVDGLTNGYPVFNPLFSCVYVGQPQESVQATSGNRKFTVSNTGLTITGNTFSYAVNQLGLTYYWLAIG